MSQVQTKSRIRESASRAEIHSCVVEKLSHYAPLSDSEARLISRLEERPRTFKANEVICGSGEELGSLFIVREGRAYTYQILGDGRRQILQLYYPGDIIGTRDIVFEQCTASTVCATEAVLCPFDKKDLKEVFEKAPKVAALIYAIGMLEQVVVLDRLKAIGRMQARERLAHFLLEVLSRSRVACHDPAAPLELRLNQETIGDVLGLTQVHVNRTFKQLERDGLITRVNGKMELQEAELTHIAEFTDRYHRIDTSWFPVSRED